MDSRFHGNEGVGGAGDGNRTHITSLEGWGSTIELRPRGWQFGDIIHLWALACVVGEGLDSGFRRNDGGVGWRVHLHPPPTARPFDRLRVSGKGRPAAVPPLDSRLRGNGEGGVGMGEWVGWRRDCRGDRPVAPTGIIRVSGGAPPSQPSPVKGEGEKMDSRLRRGNDGLGGGVSRR